MAFGIGFCIIAAYNIVNSTIFVELSEKPQVKGNKNAIAMISTLMSGVSGSLTAVYQIIIPFIGEDYLFY